MTKRRLNAFLDHRHRHNAWLRSRYWRLAVRYNWLVMGSRYCRRWHELRIRGSDNGGRRRQRCVLRKRHNFKRLSIVDLADCIRMFGVVAILPGPPGAFLVVIRTITLLLVNDNLYVFGICCNLGDPTTISILSVFYTMLVPPELT